MGRDGVRGFEEQHRPVREVRVHLLGVVGVVAPDTDDFRRLTGREDVYLVGVVGLVAKGDTAVRSGGGGDDGVAVLDGPAASPDVPRGITESNALHVTVLSGPTDKRLGGGNRTTAGCSTAVYPAIVTCGVAVSGSVTERLLRRDGLRWPMNVLVVGAGAMGQWFARTVRTHADASVAFTDLDQSAAEAAADAVGGRAVASDAAETFDVVCIAVPMPVAETAIHEFAPLATVQSSM